jgi:dTDP-4-dehydrorhamnose 3,5-epimerase
MGTVSLGEIVVTPLARIPTSDGDVLHAMKSVDSGYAGFGEAYFSCIAMGVVKGWKLHSRMTMNVVVPVGRVRFVFHLDGAGTFRVEEIGVDRYVRLTVPPGIWFGFQGLTEPQNMVLNIASIPHDPNEVQRRAIADIAYEWSSP